MSNVLQDFMPKIKGQYRTYEEVFFRKIKGNLDMPSYFSMDNCAYIFLNG